MTVEDLAREVLRMLRLQQDYFRTRSQDALRYSKDAERRLKEKCNDILHPKKPELFE